MTQAIARWLPTHGRGDGSIGVALPVRGWARSELRWGRRAIRVSYPPTSPLEWAGPLPPESAESAGSPIFSRSSTEEGVRR